MGAGVGRQRGRRQLRGALCDALPDRSYQWDRVPALLPPLQRRYQAGIVSASRQTIGSTPSTRGAFDPRRSSTPSARSPERTRRVGDRAQPEFFAGGPYRWYVAAVGAYFYCQLAVNFVVFAAFVDTRCKHHNILVVNRVDYTGLDFCALAGAEADASCGYGSATSPACAAGAANLRPLRWARKGAGIQGPTAWLGDSNIRQFFPWWMWDIRKERSAIMRETPGDRCAWHDHDAEKARDCDAWWTPVWKSISASGAREEFTPPRRRAGVASMAWRTTR